MIFIANEAKALAPECTKGELVDSRGNICPYVHESIREILTMAQRSYSANDFLPSEDGSISCKADKDCPNLSKEELLFKMQMSGSSAKNADECSVECYDK